MTVLESERVRHWARRAERLWPSHVYLRLIDTIDALLMAVGATGIRRTEVRERLLLLIVITIALVAVAAHHPGSW